MANKPKNTIRIFSVLLSLLLCINMLPAAAFAESPENIEPDESEITERADVTAKDEEETDGEEPAEPEYDAGEEETAAEPDQAAEENAKEEPDKFEQENAENSEPPIESEAPEENAAGSEEPTEPAAAEGNTEPDAELAEEEEAELADWTDYNVVISGPSTVIGGKNIQLTAAITPTPTERATIIWSLADDADRAYVTLNAGRVTAQKVGKVHTIRIKAETKEGVAVPGTFDITVLPAVSAIEMWCNGSNVTGGTVCVPVDDSSVTDVMIETLTLPVDSTQELKWTFSDKTGKFADYTDNGDGTVTISRFTGVRGSAVLTATATDGSGRSSRVTLQFGSYAQSIAFTVSELAVAGGKSLKITDTVSTDKSLTDRTVLWTLSGEAAEYAVIKNGLVTAQKVTEVKTGTVTATVKANPSVSVSDTITIYPAATSVVIEKNGENVTGKRLALDLNDGSALPFTISASVLPGDALQSVAWSSSDTKETILWGVDNGDGSYTVIGATGVKGSVRLTAKAADGSGRTASVTIQTGSFAQSISIWAPQSYVIGGRSLSFTDSVSTDKSLTDRTVLWSLSGDGAAYASVSNGRLSVKKPEKVCTVNVTATVKANPSVSATETITLYPAAAGVQILCDGSVVNGKQIVLDANDSPTLTFSAQILPEDAMRKIAWSWNDTSLRFGEYKDNGDGTVTVTGDRINSGKVTLTAKAMDGSGRSASVTVLIAHYAQSLTLEVPQTYIAGGQSLLLKAILPDTQPLSDKSVAWSVSGPGERQVSVSGGRVTVKTITEKTEVTVTAAVRNNPAACDSVTLTLYPAVRSIAIEREDGTKVNDKTVALDASGSAESEITLYSVLSPENTYGTPVWSWSDSIEKYAQYTDNGDGTVTVSGFTGAKGTVSLVVKAADGSGRGARVTLRFS